MDKSIIFVAPNGPSSRLVETDDKLYGLGGRRSSLRLWRDSGRGRRYRQDSFFSFPCDRSNFLFNAKERFPGRSPRSGHVAGHRDCRLREGRRSPWQKFGKITVRPTLSDDPRSRAAPKRRGPILDKVTGTATKRAGPDPIGSKMELKEASAVRSYP